MDLAGMKRRELQALCKRHGLSAGGSNADLVARLDAALSGTAGAEEEEEVAGVAARKRKGCLKQTAGDAAEAKKVTFAAEEGKARTRRSRVIWSPVVAKKRGKSAQASTDSAAAEDSISSEVGANVPVRRSRRNSVSAAEAEEVGEAVAVDRKCKRKNQETDEAVAVSAQVGVSSRVTRRSSLAGAAAVLPPVVEKKRGRGKAAGGSSKLAAEAQDSEPDVQNSAQVEVSARITRSHSTAPVVLSPTVAENKRRRTGDARTYVDLSTVSDVPRNDAPVTRSLRNRVVQVNNGLVDETHTARQLENKTQPSRPTTRRHQQVSSSVEEKNQEPIAAPSKAPLLRRSGRNHSEDAEKQPAVKEPVKRSTRKSVVLATLEKEENVLIAEKNPQAHVRRSTRKSIVPVKDIKGIGEEVQTANSEDAVKQPATKGPKVVDEGIQNAKGKGVEKQFVVRRSSRKSVLPDILESNSRLLAAQMNVEMNVRRSTRKSVLPNMLNEENQDHSKMARKGNFQSGKCQDDERQQKVKEPIRRSRRSVAAVPVEEKSNVLHEEKLSKNPMRRSTRKSVALNEGENVSMDHTEIVAPELERVGEEGLKLRKHRRSLLEISSSANDSWRKQQNAQIPNEKDNTGGTQQASNSTTSKGRSSKRRRTAAPEDVMSVKEANDDIMIMEATKDAHKATHEHKESSSRVQEFGQVNSTREELSSGPLLVTVTLADDISKAQNVPVVIPGSESGDNANESLDKSKQDHSDIQAGATHLSETSGELDQSSCIAGLVPHNCAVSEDKALMSKDGLSIDFTVGDREEQIPVSREGRVGLEENASEPGEKNLANVMSTGLHAKSLQYDIDIIAEETEKDELPMAFPTEEHGEKYAGSPVAVEKSVGWETSACESVGKPLTGIFSNDLHTKHLQHDCDVLTKATGEASGAAPPISESDTNPEIQCNAEESIRAVDLGKCSSRVSEGGRPSSFGLEHLFAEACKEGYSRNIENTVGDREERSPMSGEGRVGLEANASESVEKNLSDIMSSGVYTKSLQHDVDIMAEETGKESPDVCPLAFPTEEHGEKYAVSPVADEKSVGWEASTCESAGRPLTGIFSNDLHTKHLQHDCDVPTKETASGAAPPISESDTNPEIECNAAESIRVDDLGKCPSRISKGNPYLTSLHLEGAADDCVLPVLKADEGCSSDGRPSSFGLEHLFAEVCKESYSRNIENTVGDREEQSPMSGEGRAGLEANASESVEKNLADIMSTGVYAKSVQHDSDIIVEGTDKVAEESIRAADLGKCPSGRSIGKPLSTSLHVEGAADDTCRPVLNADMGCSSDGRSSSFYLELMFAEECKESYSRNTENTDVQIDVGIKPSTPVTPAFYGRSDCLEDEDVQPTKCDADKKLDVDEGVAEEDFAQEKSNGQHVPAQTELNMKLNHELSSPGAESGYSITEKNTRLVAGNLDQQAIIQVQQVDVQEGDLKEPSPCSATPECRHKRDLPEETVLPRKNTGSLSSAEQSLFGLESLFSQDNIDESMGSATAHTKNGFDDSIDCHVKSALENTHVSEPFSHDDAEGISKNDDCMHTSQQDIGMEEANLDEERVLTTFSLDAKHIKKVINSDEVACEGEESKKLVHSEDLKASSEKTDVNGPDGNSYGITDAVLSSALHTPAKDNYEICLGSNTDVLRQGHNDQCSDDTEERFTSKPWTNDINEDASAKYIESGVVLLSCKETSNLKDGQLNSKLGGAKVVESGLYCNKYICNILDSRSVGGEVTPSGSGLSKDSSKEYRQEVLDGFSVETSLDGSSTCEEKIVCRVDAIENPSVSLATSGYKHEGALSEEAARTMKNYAGTCSSNSRELLMELQSLFSKGNTTEPDPHDGLSFPSAENSGDESFNVEQRVEVHHASDLSHLNELIGCSNTVVLCQGHNHKEKSNVDRVEQVASEPCTNDMVEAAAAAKCIESRLVLPPSGQRSNLNDRQLNPELECPNIMVSGLNCDKDVCNTSDNGSIVVVVGERTPSGSGLPEDYPKDHYPRQELLDGFSVESSLKGTVFGKTTVSGVEGIGKPSSSLATPDYKYEGAFSEEAVCGMKNCTGTRSVDPRHVLMDLQSLFSEGSTEKSDLQDNLAFPSAESGRDECIICHVEKLVASEPDTYQGPCQDPSRHEEKESCMSVTMQVKESGGFLRSSHMKGSLASVQIDLADDAHLIERDIVAAVEVLCEEKAERKSLPTSDSDILQEKSYPTGHGICQSRSQKHIVEANSRLFSCRTEVLHQDHKECNEPNEGKFIPKALVENNMTEDAPIEGIGSSMMVPLVAGMSEVPDEQLSTKMSDESEELSFSCDKDTIENFCTGPAKRDLYQFAKDFHIDSCQKQEVPEVFSSPKSPEESAKFQCVRVSGSGPCQRCVNESTSMQVTYNTEMVNQDQEEYNQNNEDQITPAILASSVPEVVDTEIDQSEMEIGLIPVTKTCVLPVPDEQPNSKLEGNKDKITPGILANSVPEAVEIELSKMEGGLIPAAETSVLLVPDEQPNSKLEGNGVYEHSYSYDKDFSILSDSESLKREVSSLCKNDCMVLSSEDNHPNDLPAPRSPEQSAYFQKDNDSGSVGICQSSRQRGIGELRAKLPSFKVSSTVKGSYIGMSAPCPKPRDSMSQSAIALLRNIENTTAVKASHPVKPNADGKDSSRRALQPISGRPREH